MLLGSHKTPLLAQAETSLSFNPRTSFDKAPWLSARAAAMAEAISPIANGPEAAYYNPAAIGGLHYKQSRAALDHLHFPLIGIAADASSLSLNSKLQEGRNLDDPSVAEDLLRAYDGSYPYARLSMAPSFGLYRSIFALVYDVRATSTPKALGSDVIDLSYRSQLGPLIGFSLAAPKRDFYFGVSAAYVQRVETQASLPLAIANNGSARQDALRSLDQTYTGYPVHIGGIWSFAADWRPALSLVCRNLGSTRFSPQDADREAYKDREDTTVGVSVSPNLGGWGMLNLVLEAGEVAWSDKAWEDKLRFGSELTVGNEFGYAAGLSLRMGLRRAGFSYGIGGNLGLVNLEASSFVEDIGLAGERVVERRNVINLAINLAE